MSFRVLTLALDLDGQIDEQTSDTVLSEMNQANCSEKYSFEDIYSSNSDTLNCITGTIENIWEIRYANGRMKKM